MQIGLSNHLVRFDWARPGISRCSSAGAHMACNEVGSAGADRPAGARMGRDGAGVAGVFYGVPETGYVSFWSYLFAFMSFLVIYLLSCYFHVSALLSDIFHIVSFMDLSFNFMSDLL